RSGARSSALLESKLIDGSPRLCGRPWRETSLSGRSEPVCYLSAFGREADVHGRMTLSSASAADDAVDGACSAASKCHRLVASKLERFKEVRPGNDDGVLKFGRNWRGHDDVMQTRSIRGSGEPVWVIALLKCALTIGTRSAQSIMASGFTAAQAPAHLIVSDN